MACGICSWKCLTNVFYIVFTICVITYARAMYHISILAPMWSEQWWAEMIWWSKWLLLKGFDIAPLPTSLLQHRHSSMTVSEFFPATDPQAYDKWLECHQHDENLCILRNLFDVYPENKMQYFNNTQYLRDNIDMTQTVEHFQHHLNGAPQLLKAKLSDLLDKFDDYEDRTIVPAMIFYYGFLENNPAINNAYKDFLKNALSEKVEAAISGVRKKTVSISHTFLYQGNDYASAQHAAFIPDYFLQIANSKTWKFINKKYFPYVGLKKMWKIGLCFTPFYWVADYPAPGIPHTEFTLNPGDLLWFSTWHPHEVHNVDPDKMGLAIGIRETMTGLLKEKFFPLLVYNIQSLVLIPNSANNKNSASNLKIAETCENPNGIKGYIVCFNGTMTTRCQMRKDETGKCQITQRDLSYQEKELLGEWDVEEWYPKQSIITSSFQ